jgi:signal transduction histidine kinase/CheY-like chemotaxis protein
MAPAPAAPVPGQPRRQPATVKRLVRRLDRSCASQQRTQQESARITKQMTLLARLFVLVILTLLPVVATEVYNEIDTRAMRAEEGRHQALRLVRLVGNEQSKIIEAARQLLTALGMTPAVRGHDALACAAYFEDLVRGYPQYLSLVSIDLAGRRVCAGGTTAADAGLHDRPAFRLAIESGGFAVGDYEADGPSAARALYVALPFDDGAGHTRGVVAAGLSLDWLNDELARIPLPPKATVSVIDRRGTILARHPGAAQFVGSTILGSSHSYLLSGGEGVQEAIGFDGISRIYAYAPVPGGPGGLTVSVGLDKDELFKGATDANRRDILAIAGSCVLALLLAAIGARVFIGRPIRDLLETAERWRQGEFDARSGISEARSEFGRLGAAFNTMAAAMGLREHELETRVRERTEAQHAAEAALYESQKIETVGRLTGGVAHDFNNILAAIVGNLELARARLGPDHAVAKRLDAALQSAHRGAGLVHQLLAFARRQTLHPEVVDLNRHIRASRDMLQRLLRSDVTVETRLCPHAWHVRVDPNQLEAAILNLAINARDAMPNGGTLRVETRNADSADAAALNGLPGDFVALTVSDTGTGIPPDILTKVYEPFFTTKEIGSGSGLGLSMVQGFARQSAGAVSIDSTVGKGTSVTLYLPRTTETPVAGAPEAEEPAAGEGTVLLVDDDAEVRTVAAEMLTLSGYRVLTAASAAEAIERFRRDGDRIDMLVSDLVLPDGMSGIDLAEALTAQRAALPVLLITGYSEALLDEAHTGGRTVLSKPFGHAALARAVGQEMRRARQERALARAFEPAR